MGGLEAYVLPKPGFTSPKTGEELSNITRVRREPQRSFVSFEPWSRPFFLCCFTFFCSRSCRCGRRYCVSVRVAVCEGRGRDCCARRQVDSFERWQQWRGYFYFREADHL